MCNLAHSLYMRMYKAVFNQETKWILAVKATVLLIDIHSNAICNAVFTLAYNFVE